MVAGIRRRKTSSNNSTDDGNKENKPEYADNNEMRNKGSGASIEFPEDVTTASILMMDVEQQSSFGVSFPDFVF